MPRCLQVSKDQGRAATCELREAARMQRIQEGPALHLHQQARLAVMPAVSRWDALHVSHKEVHTQHSSQSR